MEPYVGPRPFERSETELFFGRLGETRLLVSMVLASRVVLLYALSGAGKTSLLNAAVVPALEREEYFEVFAPARVRGPTLEGLPADGVNPYVAGVLSHWSDEPADSVQALLERFPHPPGPDGFPRPRAIIVDQLEEVFTVHPDRWRERPALFAQLADALERDPLLRVILAIREDYLAQLEPFRPLLPGRLENRIRLELLHPDAAHEAVAGPLRTTGRNFAPGVAERLVSDLRATAVLEDAGKRLEFEGQHIEPVQLQLACSALWRDLPADVTEITDEHVTRFGDVDQVLTDFYDDAITASGAAAGIAEPRLREDFADTFITSMHTRGTAYQSGGSVGRIPLTAVQELERRRVLRAEWRANARWYELTHDRLIEPIERSNQAAIVRSASDLGRVVRGALGAMAGALVSVLPATIIADAVRRGLPPSIAADATYRGLLSAFVLSAAALGWALAGGRVRPLWRAATACAIGAVIGATAVLARAAADAAGLGPSALLAIEYGVLGAAAGRAGIIAPGGWIAAAAAAAGGALAGEILGTLVFGNLLVPALIVYVFIVATAWLPALAAAGGRAPDEAARRRRPRSLAAAAVLLALLAVVVLVVGSSSRTNLRRDAALARALAAQSAGASDPEAAALLSIESFRVRPTQESVDSMARALARLQPAIHAGVGQVTTVAVSPDGRTIAAGGTRGVIRLLGPTGRRRSPAMSQPAGVASVAISPDGRVLASAADDGVLSIWDLRTMRLLRRRRGGDALNSVAFVPPHGDRVSTAGDDGVISLSDVLGSGTSEIVKVSPQPMTSLGFSPDGRTLASGGQDGAVQVLDVAQSLRPRASLRAARGGVLTVAFSPDGGHVAAGGTDGVIRLWAKDRSPPTATLRGHTGSVFGVAFSPNGRLLASAGDDGTVRVWQGDRTAVLSVFPGSALSVLFSPDMRTLIAGGADGTVRLLDDVLWSGDPAAIRRAICARVDRPLTRSEWDLYMSPTQPYRRTCG